VELCRDVEKQLQGITTVGKNDAYHYLYEKPYNPDELFQRYFLENITINYSYWGLNSLEESVEVMKTVINSKLSYQQKFILNLYYKSRLTQNQIAKMLGKSQPAINMLLERIREKLRTEFEYLRENLRKPQK